MANSVLHRLPFPVRGYLYTVFPQFYKSDGTRAAPTSLDSEVSIDGGTYADCAEEVTLIKEVGGSTDSADGYLTLTAASMLGDSIALQIKSANCVPWTRTLEPVRLPQIATGTAAAGAAGTITLAVGSSAVDDYYNGCIIGNISTGEARLILDYVGSTRVATVGPNWVTTPTNAHTYEILLTEMASNVRRVLGTVDGTVAGVTPSTFDGDLSGLEQEGAAAAAVAGLALDTSLTTGLGNVTTALGNLMTGLADLATEETLALVKAITDKLETMLQADAELWQFTPESMAASAGATPETFVATLMATPVGNTTFGARLAAMFAVSALNVILAAMSADEDETLQVVQGDTPTINLVCKDANGDPYSLADSVVLFTVRASKGMGEADDSDAVVLAEAMVDDEDAGTCHVDLTSEQTGALDLGTYYYDLRVVTGEGEAQVVATPLRGVFEVLWHVTGRTETLTP